MKSHYKPPNFHNFIHLEKNLEEIQNQTAIGKIEKDRKIEKRSKDQKKIERSKKDRKIEKRSKKDRKKIESPNRRGG